MQEEKVIRDEAKQFYVWHIGGGGHGEPIKQFHQIRERLEDFYSPEYKAIFLDEIQNTITEQLLDHRNKAHGGKPKPDCQYETSAEKLLFYINQEISTLPVFAHQKRQSNPEEVRDKVFISYSHFDKEYLLDIQRHFKPFLSHINF